MGSALHRHVRLVVSLLAARLLSRRASPTRTSSPSTQSGSRPSSSTRPGTGFRPRSSSRAGPRQVPDGFRFAVKASPQALRSLGTFEERVRMLGDRLGPGPRRRREPARRRPARAPARLDRPSAGARPARRELGRRRRRTGRPGRTTGTPTRRSGISASASRRTPRSSSQGSRRRIEPLLDGGPRGLRVLPARGRADRARATPRGCSSSSGAQQAVDVGPPSIARAELRLDFAALSSLERVPAVPKHLSYRS